MDLETRVEELLEREEGFVPYAFPDSKGYLTIGIGTLIDKRRGDGISKAAAWFMLREKVVSIAADLDAAIPWWRSLTDDRQAVLVSMVYQMGTSGLLKFKRTLAAMQRGDYEAASAGMLASKWAREDSPERAKRAADAMLTGSLDIGEDA